MKLGELLRLPTTPTLLPGAGALFGMVLCSYLVLGALLSQVFEGRMPEGYLGASLLNVGTMLGAALPAVVLLLSRRMGGRALGVVTGTPLPRLLAAGAGIWLLGMVLLTPLIGLYQEGLSWAGVPNTAQPLYRKLAEDLAAGRVEWALILVVTLAVPLGEELVFRGFLHAALRNWLSRGGTVVVAGIFFGLLHFQPPTMIVPLTLIGCLFGWIRERTGSLWAAWLAHVLQNGLSILFSPYLIHWYDKV